MSDDGVVRPFVPGGPPAIGRTVADAIRIVWTNPRQCLGPLLVIQVPAAIVTGIITIVLYATTFSEKPVVAPVDVLFDGDRAQQFWWWISTAGEALFAQVARGATIVAIAGVATGKPTGLQAALDPAFTRLGGLLILIVGFSAGAGLLFLSFIGIPVAIYLLIRLALTFDAYMLEGLSPGLAVRRSWDLTRGRMLRLMGVLALGLLAIFPVFIFASALAGLSGDSRTSDILLIAGTGVAQVALVVPALAVLTATTTLFYLNVRASDHGSHPS